MTFQQRLQTAMRGGNLTVADLARWFDVPYPTIRGWVRDGHQPAGGAIDRANYIEALDRLERAIKRKDGLPLRRLSAPLRIEALAAVRKRNMRGMYIGEKPA